jgi:VanZ family protein
MHRGIRMLAATGGWLCLAIILVASFVPSSSANLGGSDKLGHFLAYSALSACWIAAGEASVRRLAIVFLGCVVLGGAVELLQPLLQRDAGWLDAGANTAGSLFGVFLGWLCDRLIVQKL